MNNPVEWQSSDSHFFFNPRLPTRERKWLEQAQFPKVQGHIWLASSGSSSSHQIKCIALSKQALLVSAQAVNSHLHVSASDSWLNVLPHFHVGGLGIWARAHVAGTSVATMDFARWSAQTFKRQLQATKATLTALVPTQVYDLVKENIPSPGFLRAVIVGGGALDNNLYLRARELGWPLLPSYGLSECCSQVATAELSGLEQNNPSLKVLPHVELRIVSDCIELKSQSLLSGWLLLGDHTSDFVDPKVDGWFKTEDLATLECSILKIHGRIQQSVKVGGELVNVSRLNAVLKNILAKKQLSDVAVVVATPSQRLGQQIDMVIEKEFLNAAPELIDEFNYAVHPFERVRTLYVVNQLPRSELKKIKWAQLLVDLGFTSVP